jgi:hypothetical protein
MLTLEYRFSAAPDGNSRRHGYPPDSIPGIFDWTGCMSSRVPMSLYAIQSGASPAGLGVVSVFFVNAALMPGGGHAHHRDASRQP